MTSCRLAVRIFDVTVLSRELKAILTRLYFPRAILTVYRGGGGWMTSNFHLPAPLVDSWNATVHRIKEQYRQKLFAVSQTKILYLLPFGNKAAISTSIRYDTISRVRHETLLARNFDTRRVLYGINRVCSVETAHPPRPRVTGALNLR